MINLNDLAPELTGEVVEFVKGLLPEINELSERLEAFDPECARPYEGWREVVQGPDSPLQSSRAGVMAWSAHYTGAIIVHTREQIFEEGRRNDADLPRATVAALARLVEDDGSDVEPQYAGQLPHLLVTLARLQTATKLAEQLILEGTGSQMIKAKDCGDPTCPGHQQPGAAQGNGDPYARLRAGQPGPMNVAAVPRSSVDSDPGTGQYL